ncbi:unnamed protein product [Allacma fusca]|uniref:C2 domain-containing protein n=1 Tax=Allacma fusca TaxID=39272 RepID=A0A8J2NKY0_9HEXA|nr:unnamed protein product [Allacma fusca]
MTKFLSMANKTKVAATMGGDGRRGGRRQLDAWVPGTAGNTTSTVEISISCRNLLNKDLLSKSDPLCVVYNRPPGSKSWVPFKRTEVIDDDLNPDFVTKVVMDYRFEQVQALRFEIYDIDSHAAKLSKQDILGFVETNLGQIASAGEEGMTLELNSTTHVVATNPNQVRREPQTIILIAEELASEKDEILLKIAGNSCGSWSGCLPPRSYFCVSKLNDAGKWIVVYRSKIARGSNPTYQPMKISCRSLCNGDLDRELKIDIYQRKFSGKLVSVGYLSISVNKLLKAGQERQPLLTPNGQSAKSGLRVLSCAMTPISTFLDFIQSGTQIHCCFAIDFTCSNGDPTDNQSLHYISNISSQPNPYEQAIQAVGNILKEYDSASLFPTYGFGARIPPKGEISHNFFVTLTKSPNCCSVPGVLEAYR